MRTLLSVLRRRADQYIKLERALDLVYIAGGFIAGLDFHLAKAANSIPSASGVMIPAFMLSGAYFGFKKAKHEWTFNEEAERVDNERYGIPLSSRSSLSGERRRCTIEGFVESTFSTSVGVISGNVASQFIVAYLQNQFP